MYWLHARARRQRRGQRDPARRPPRRPRRDVALRVADRDLPGLQPLRRQVALRLQLQRRDDRQRHAARGEGLLRPSLRAAVQRRQTTVPRTPTSRTSRGSSATATTSTTSRAPTCTDGGSGREPQGVRLAGPRRVLVGADALARSPRRATRHRALLARARTRSTGASASRAARHRRGQPGGGVLQDDPVRRDRPRSARPARGATRPAPTRPRTRSSARCTSATTTTGASRSSSPPRRAAPRLAPHAASTSMAGASTSLGTSLVGWEWNDRVANGLEPAGTQAFTASPVDGELVQNNGRSYVPGNATATGTLYKAAERRVGLVHGHELLEPRPREQRLRLRRAGHERPAGHRQRPGRHERQAGDAGVRARPGPGRRPSGDVDVARRGRDRRPDRGHGQGDVRPSARPVDGDGADRHPDAVGRRRRRGRPSPTTTRPSRSRSGRPRPWTRSSPTPCASRAARVAWRAGRRRWPRTRPSAFTTGAGHAAAGRLDQPGRRRDRRLRRHDRQGDVRPRHGPVHADDRQRDAAQRRRRRPCRARSPTTRRAAP